MSTELPSLSSACRWSRRAVRQESREQNQQSRFSAHCLVAEMPQLRVLNSPVFPICSCLFGHADENMFNFSPPVSCRRAIVERSHRKRIHRTKSHSKYLSTRLRRTVASSTMPRPISRSLLRPHVLVPCSRAGVHHACFSAKDETQ